MATAALALGDDDEGATYETARIRESIAETRESISDTIDAIQERLKPGVLADQAKIAVREATIGKVEDMMHEAEQRISRTGHSVADSIRRHPVPLVVAGAGVAWFVASHRKDRARERGPRLLVEERVTTRAFGEEGFGAAVVETAEPPRRRRVIGGDGHRGGEIAERPEGVVETVKRAAHDVAEKAEEITSEGAEKVTSVAREAQRTASRAVHEAGERGRRLESRLEDLFFENPLAAGALALAVGMAVGLAIPISRKEEEWMGPAREKLADKASELAHAALEKVEEAAGKVEETAGKVEETARDVAQDAARPGQPAKG